ADALTTLLRDIAREKIGAEARVLLFVDALDEADEPDRAVQFLPRLPLPPGVFVIVSSRPRIGERDHLAPLRAAGAHEFPIAGNAKLNLDDLEDYLQDRLAGNLGKGQARALAEKLAGIFQLAVYFVE